MSAERTELIDRYDVRDFLGKGGYGEVYRAYDKLKKQDVAIKIIDLEANRDEMQDAQREITVMANLHCPQLIQYYTSFVVDTQLWIIMEYLDGGSLLDIIKQYGAFPESYIAYILREVLLALDYLHNNERKIHRDIKAANILVKNNGLVKLGDFGVSGQLTDSIDKRRTRIGTDFWMAPEVITGPQYDELADIWSLGITAIELAKGVPPYADRKLPLFRIIFLIPRSPPPKLEGNFSDNFKDFVSKCLIKDPTQRWTSTQLLSHPFIESATLSEEWKSFINEQVIVNRVVPKGEVFTLPLRVNSTDSRYSAWNFTLKQMGGSESFLVLKNLSQGSSHSEQIPYGLSFSPRTPYKDSEDFVLSPALHHRGMMSPTQKRKAALSLLTSEYTPPPLNLSRQTSDNSQSGGRKMVPAEELSAYHQMWKEKEDSYILEIQRLQEELGNLKVHTQPFLSAISVIEGNDGLKEESSSNADHFEKKETRLGIVTNEEDLNAMEPSDPSFQQLRLSVSSTNTTPGNSRALTPTAVIRDNLFANYDTIASIENSITVSRAFQTVESSLPPLPPQQPTITANTTNLTLDLNPAEINFDRSTSFTISPSISSSYSREESGTRDSFQLSKSEETIRYLVPAPPPIPRNESLETAPIQSSASSNEESSAYAPSIIAEPILRSIPIDELMRQVIQPTLLELRKRIISQQYASSMNDENHQIQHQQQQQQIEDLWNLLVTVLFAFQKIEDRNKGSLLHDLIDLLTSFSISLRDSQHPEN